ncbi:MULTISPECIES: hypothetical protein [unclassified Actinotignum]|uniref:hypothetical protein n=1 Tax=unclassified Actinotignum TaxID=2632702 RepID=UPI003F45C5D3
MDIFCAGTIANTPQWNLEHTSLRFIIETGAAIKTTVIASGRLARYLGEELALKRGTQVLAYGAIEQGDDGGIFLAPYSLAPDFFPDWSTP